MIVECRQYRLNPGALPKYLSLFSSEAGVMDRLEPYLEGFWVAESGELNTVVHLWRYQDRVDRAVARTAMAADPNMQAFMAKVTPLLQSQNSMVMTGKLGTNIDTERNGIFDMLKIKIDFHADSDVSNSIVQSIIDCVSKIGILVCGLQTGFFESCGGLLEALLIIRYPSLLERERVALNLAEKLSNYSNCDQVISIEKVLLMPAPFSPRQ